MNGESRVFGVYRLELGNCHAEQPRRRDIEISGVNSNIERNFVNKFNDGERVYYGSHDKAREFKEKSMVSSPGISENKKFNNQI